MERELFEKVIKFFVSQDWKNVIPDSLSSLIGSLLGVYVGGRITYKVTKRLDMGKLRKDLELKAAEEMLICIEELLNKLITANILIMSFNRNVSIYLNSRTNIDNNIIQEVSDAWNDYAKAYNKMLFKFDARRIVLREFWYIRELVYDECNLLREMENECIQLISDIYYNRILMGSEIVPQEVEDLEEKLSIFNDKSFDILSYLYDLQIKLQNQFLNDIFDNYKISYREPLDSKYKVLK
ncbi:hypothetical protein CPJCM30710_25480 [Clostridium polyendosporum]|uniref:Uncharacterized protein n=1 Tax=Clostridium polyendosporum TaxID=69208 RepID=A0A919VH52_9CLOT|nr:hypothetical protein [Clostridium polyendosporum]GIM29882.1 hypothetical protein CPJCM30710_25480 [Clostridium polyendosporum]